MIATEANSPDTASAGATAPRDAGFSFDAPSGGPADRWARALPRAMNAAIALFWAAVFIGVWLPAPPLAKALAVAWAVLGAAAPNVFLVTLALALPWFGNNPGGPRALYLLDLGLMGFVGRDLAARALGRRAARAHPLNAPVLVFLWLSAATLAPQWRYLLAEARWYPGSFIHNLYSHYATAGVYGGRAWLNLALSVCVFRSLRDAPPSARWINRFLLAALAAAVMTAALGLLEFPGLIGLEWWRPPNAYISRFGYARLMSLFWHSGWYAQYAAAVAPVAAALAFTARSARTRRLSVAAFGVLGLAQVFTMQRGGWLAFVGGGLAVAAAQALALAPARRNAFAKRVALGLIACALALGAIAAVHAPLRHRLGEMLIFEDRALIWRGGLKLSARAPLGGTGIGNYSMVHHMAYADDTPEAKADDRTTAHNLFIQIAAERGIPAALLLALLFGTAFAGLIRAQPADANRPRAGELEIDNSPNAGLLARRIRLAALGGMAALLIDGMFQYTFYMRVTEILVWVFLGLATLPGIGAAEAEAEAEAVIIAGRRSGEMRSRSTRFRAMWARPIWAYGLTAAALFLWSDRAVFAPYPIFSGAEAFTAGGKRVRLALPPGAKRIAIRVSTADIGVFNGEPLTYTFSLGSEELARHVFTKHEPADIELDLPPDRDPATPLTIRADRVWRPYIDTWRNIPIDTAGVCYQPLRVLE